MPRSTHTFVELELSQDAYDEIERKLLDAGYEHAFAAGPGSAIDMHDIAVTRTLDPLHGFDVPALQALRKASP